MSFFDVTGSPLATHLLSTDGAAARSAIESISGKPTAHFLQASPPSTVGLATGSVWREINGAGVPVEDWYWSGTLWLSLARWVSASYRSGSGGANADFADLTQRASDNQLWLDAVSVEGFQVNNGNASNYYSLVIRSGFGSAYSNIATFTTVSAIAGVRFGYSQTINQVLNSVDVINWSWIHTTVGTPGTIRISHRVITRRIRSV